MRKVCNPNQIIFHRSESNFYYVRMISTCKNYTITNIHILKHRVVRPKIIHMTIQRVQSYTCTCKTKSNSRMCWYVLVYVFYQRKKINYYMRSYSCTWVMCGYIYMWWTYLYIIFGKVIELESTKFANMQNWVKFKVIEENLNRNDDHGSVRFEQLQEEDVTNK